MKKGKDDEKVMGPMFPRLHVNDTEKGGPRAPPRNKMALYEQLSIPSQRFKPSLAPSNSNHNVNSASVIPPSSSQGSSQQRAMLFSHQLQPSRQAADRTNSRSFDSGAPLVQLERKKSEEDEFMVPIFMQSNMVQDCVRSCNNMDREKVSGQASAPQSLKRPATSNDMPKQMSPVGPTIRQETRSHHNDVNLNESVPSRGQSIKAVSNSSSSMNNDEVALWQNNSSLYREPGDSAVNNCRLQKSDRSLLPEHRAACDPTSRLIGDAILNESSRCKNNNGNSSITGWDCHSKEQRIIDDSESREDRTCQSLPAGIAERADDTSDTSMNSVSGIDITPDDVVGIIGQKHFWKARRAIINQQRVFAVQVFELHRLLKVQKLIAGVPNLLEDNTFLAKTVMVSPTKKRPLEYTVETPPSVAKFKNDAEKPNHKMEFSAENTVGKASQSSEQNGSHEPPSYRPFSASSPGTSLNGDPNQGSLCFHQSQGHHQWLVPVMSPSEGLVYKPYPGPGSMAPACGGCGPPGAMPPMMGNFFTPPYGVPPPNYYQGMGVSPFASSTGPHGFFPPYGMPAMHQAAMTGSAVDQTNHFAASGFHGNPPGGVRADSNIQRQNSRNLPSPKHRTNGVAPEVTKVHASRNSEVQVSTASSPSERVQKTARGNGLEGSNMLSLFPTSPVTDPSNNGAQPSDINFATRVIRVVPHNKRSATESAARIFQSIQEERKQYDSA